MAATSQPKKSRNIIVWLIVGVFVVIGVILLVNTPRRSAGEVHTEKMSTQTTQITGSMPAVWSPPASTCSSDRYFPVPYPGAGNEWSKAIRVPANCTAQLLEDVSKDCIKVQYRHGFQSKWVNFVPGTRAKLEEFRLQGCSPAAGIAHARLIPMGAPPPIVVETPTPVVLKTAAAKITEEPDALKPEEGAKEIKASLYTTNSGFPVPSVAKPSPQTPPARPCDGWDALVGRTTC